MKQRKFSKKLEFETVRIRAEVQDYTQEQKNEIMKKFFGQLKDAGMYRLDDQEDEPKASVSDE